MSLLVQIVQVEIQVFVLALAGLIGIKLLTGEINTSGLLHGRIHGRRREQDRYFSPERVQLLVFTLGAALYYLNSVLSNPHPGVFPQIPATWPAIIGGSNAVYLGGKAWARWMGNKSNVSETPR